MKQKLIFSLFVFCTLLLNIKLGAQGYPCIGMTKETIAPNPQSGSYNYFGVKVTLSHTWDEDIVVRGYIYDVSNENTNTPFELTITKGELSAQTSETFYQTTASAAGISYSEILPVFVTYNGTIYRTIGECTEFDDDFVDLATVAADSIQAAVATSDALLTGFDDDDLIDFFEYLKANGISGTASHYNLSSTDVTTLKNKYEAAWTTIWNKIRYEFGQVDSITLNQYETFLPKSIDAYRFSRQAPEDLGLIGGPCEDAFRNCQNGADNHRVSMWANCRDRFPNTTTLFNFFLNMGGYAICLIRADNNYLGQLVQCAADLCRCNGGPCN